MISSACTLFYGFPVRYLDAGIVIDTAASATATISFSLPYSLADAVRLRHPRRVL